MAEKRMSINELPASKDIQKTLDDASIALRAFLILIAPNIIDGRPYLFDTEDTFELLLSILDQIDSARELPASKDIQNTLDDASIALKAFLILISPSIIDDRPYHFDTEDTFDLLLSILDQIDSSRGKLLSDRKTMTKEYLKVLSVSVMEEKVLTEGKATFYVEEKDGRQKTNETLDVISGQECCKDIQCPEESSQSPETGGKFEDIIQEYPSNEIQNEDAAVEGYGNDIQTENITGQCPENESQSEIFIHQDPGNEYQPGNMFQKDLETENVSHQGSLIDCRSEDITVQSPGTHSLPENITKQASVIDHSVNNTETSQPKNVHGDDYSAVNNEVINYEKGDRSTVVLLTNTSKETFEEGNNTPHQNTPLITTDKIVQCPRKPKRRPSHKMKRAPEPPGPLYIKTTKVNVGFEVLGEASYNAEENEPDMNVRDKVQNIILQSNNSSNKDEVYNESTSKPDQEQKLSRMKTMRRSLTQFKNFMIRPFRACFGK